MSIFFSLFVDGISCIFYGVLIAIAVAFGIYLAVVSIKNTKPQSIPFFASLALTFVVVLVNMSIMTGAIKIKGIAGDTLTAIQQIQETVANTNFNGVGNSISNGNYSEALQQMSGSASIDFNNLQNLKKDLGGNWDLLKLYFDANDMSTTMLFLSPVSTIDSFNRKMNSVIIGNILWSVAFIGLSIFLGCKGAGASRSQARSKGRYQAASSRRYDDDF